MTDIALFWDNETSAADMRMAGGDLAADDGMRSAILISLFSDARVSDDADLPEEGDDHAGWWGDQFADDAGIDAGSATDRNRIGSELWLLGRSKVTEDKIVFARQAAERALGWLTRDGVVSKVVVEVEAQQIDAVTAQLALGIEVFRPDGTSKRYDFTWEASIA